MHNLLPQDTDRAVSGLSAVRTALIDQLAYVDAMAEKVQLDAVDVPGNDNEISMTDCKRIRASVLSALASLDEILGWVRLLAAKDPDGNELPCVRRLPSIDLPQLN